MITRMHRLSGLDALHDLWERWEQWFAEVEETHSSLPVLVFYRSQQHNHSWVNAVGGGHGRGRAVRSAVAIAMGRPGRPHDPCRLPRPSPDRDLLPHRLRPAPGPMRRHQHRPRAVRPRRSRSSRRPACRWSRTATRPGATSTAGASTTTRSLRGLEKLTMAPTPWWDRPMHSAWETDEPLLDADAQAAPADAAPARRRPRPRRSGRRLPRQPEPRGGAEPRGGDQPGGHDQRHDHAQDADAPHPPVDRPERLALVGVVVVAVVVAVIGRGPVAALDGVGRAVLVADRVLVVGRRSSRVAASLRHSLSHPRTLDWRRC